MSWRNINVLMSSYNGEQYIEKQIESIFAQEEVNLRLLIRDDGSTDETPMLLKKLACKYDNIQFSVEQNIGLVRSFFTLLARADASVNYFAFADQDDVWQPRKLSNALKMLQAHDQSKPLMYCARVEYVDAQLVHLGFSPIYIQEKIAFGNALVQNIATGCTIVLNQAAREKILSKLPQKCLVHDWWMYIVVSAFGKVVYDSRPCMKYRQHSSNVIGASASFFKRLSRRFHRFLHFSDATKASIQVHEFYRLFGNELDPNKKANIERMLRLNKAIFGRFRLVFDGYYWRQSSFDQILLRLVILSGRF